MTFPRFRPVAGRNLFDLDSCRCDIDPIGRQCLESFAEASLNARHILGLDLTVNADRGQSGEGIGVGRGGLSPFKFQQDAHGIFSGQGSGDGNGSEEFAHASRQGVKLRS